MSASLPRFSDTARRARLAQRHALHPAHRAASVLAVTEAMTALHATEPHSVHLAVAARTNGLTPATVDAALYDDRSIVKQLAMRRTLFAFPRDLLPAALGSAADRVAAQQRTLLAKDAEKHGVAADGAAWVATAREAVLGHLADGSAYTAVQLREALPQLEGRTQRGEQKWALSTPLAPRVLTLLGAEGAIFRGVNDGHWRTSRPRWTLAETWLGGVPDRLDERAGYAELVRRWLHTFGPGTETDIVWWLGATKAAVRRALADVEAARVQLDDGEIGYLLPDDVVDADDPGPWVALLPVLDPTVMGWKQRDFYLDAADVSKIFDRNGNGGATAWVDGRIVGTWVQDEQGFVRVVPCRDVPSKRRKQLDAEAARLTEFLDGVVIKSVYKSPLMIEARS